MGSVAVNTDVDDKILSRIYEQLQETLECKNIPNDKWFVVCGQGSINYEGMSDEESDVDSKLLVIPTFKEIVNNKKPINGVHEMLNNGEHCDYKDVREYFKIFRKQNINFVEILFTDYWYCNDLYTDLWLEMRQHAEEFARMNPYRTLKCCKGVCYEKQHALEHRYPSRLYCIDTYGYDGKQLSHALRVYDFAKKFTEGYFYKDCLKPTNPSYLLSIKRHTASIELEQARNMMSETIEKMDKLEAQFNKYHKDEENQESKEILDDILYRLLERSVKADLN